MDVQVFVSSQLGTGRLARGISKAGFEKLGAVSYVGEGPQGCQKVEKVQKELSAVPRPKKQRQVDQKGFQVRWALAHDRMCLNLET